MNSEHNILTEYQNSDEEQRLSLFLSHRNLRDAFMKIEQQPRSIPAKFPVKSKTTTRPGALKQFWKQLNASCCHAFKQDQS